MEYKSNNGMRPALLVQAELIAPRLNAGQVEFPEYGG